MSTTRACVKPSGHLDYINLGFILGLLSRNVLAMCRDDAVAARLGLSSILFSLSELMFAELKSQNQGSRECALDELSILACFNEIVVLSHHFMDFQVKTISGTRVDCCVLVAGNQLWW